MLRLPDRIPQRFHGRHIREPAGLVSEHSSREAGGPQRPKLLPINKQRRRTAETQRFRFFVFDAPNLNIRFDRFGLQGVADVRPQCRFGAAAER